MPARAILLGETRWDNRGYRLAEHICRSAGGYGNTAQHPGNNTGAGNQFAEIVVCSYIMTHVVIAVFQARTDTRCFCRSLHAIIRKRMYGTFFRIYKVVFLLQGSLVTQTFEA